MTEKIFIGNTKTHTFQDGGRLIKLGLPLEDLTKYAKNGWVNLIVAKKKEAKGDEKDFYAYIDTFEPKTQQTEAPKSPADSMREGYNPEKARIEDEEEHAPNIDTMNIHL